MRWPDPAGIGEISEWTMARKLIDISVALQVGIASDPPRALPKITYLDHHATAPGIAEYFGVAIDQLPQGEYAAVEGARSARIMEPTWTRLITIFHR
jgi:hypothetical protein